MPSKPMEQFKQSTQTWHKTARQTMLEKCVGISIIACARPIPPKIKLNSRFLLSPSESCFRFCDLLLTAVASPVLCLNSEQKHASKIQRIINSNPVLYFSVLYHLRWEIFWITKMRVKWEFTSSKNTSYKWTKIFSNSYGQKYEEL